MQILINVRRFVGCCALLLGIGAGDTGIRVYIACMHKICLYLWPVVPQSRANLT